MMFVVGGSSTWRACDTITNVFSIFSLTVIFCFSHLLRLWFRLWKTNLFISKRMLYVCSFVTLLVIVCASVCVRRSVCTSHSVYILFALYRAQTFRCGCACVCVCARARLMMCVVKITERERLCGWMKMKIPKYGPNERRLCWCSVVAMTKKKSRKRRRSGKWWWWWADRCVRRALGFGYRKNDVPRIGRFLRTQIEEYKYWVCPFQRFIRSCAFFGTTFLNG